MEFWDLAWPSLHLLSILSVGGDSGLCDEEERGKRTFYSSLLLSLHLYAGGHLLLHFGAGS